MGKKTFEKQVKHHIEHMTAKVNELSDQVSKLEYVRLMRYPDSLKENAQKRISLIMQNRSLLMMQFMSEKEIPSEEQLEEEINQKLS